MDNVTHALAGCLLAAATVGFVERRGVQSPRSFRVAASLVGIITAELPDVDLVYAGSAMGMGKLGYLLHHRGHTHTVLFAVVGALLIWFAVLARQKELRRAPFRNALLALALLGTVSHLTLDYTNNYGLHPFWPVVNRWYYGDAVFIVEPWFWVIAIPPLFLFYRGRVSRTVLASLLVIILAASWLVGMVGGGVAVALTAVTIIWIQMLRVVHANRRISLAIGSWVALECLFGVASAQARAAVKQSVSMPTYRDASLTPFIGNPLCYHALVVEVDGSTYRATNAIVAPFSQLRSAATCAASDQQSFAAGPGVAPTIATHTSTESVQWSNEWSAPLADLKRLVASNCEIAAAMKFIRVPIWSALPDGDVEIGDARFGVGGRGFASVTAAVHPKQCPRWLPGWAPPRADLLR